MTYHFMGANTPKNDATTTTDGLQDVELVLKSEQGGRSSHREKERFTELGEVKVMTERGGWKEVCAEKPHQATRRLLSEALREETVLLLTVPDLYLRGVPHQQNVPGSRSCNGGR